MSAPGRLVLVGAVAVLLVAGCSGVPVRSGNTVHYLIIGIGVVSVPADQETADIRVTRLNALGVSLVDQPGLRLGLGYASGTVVAVPERVEDVRVEVSHLPFGPLHVRANDSFAADRASQTD